MKIVRLSIVAFGLALTPALAPTLAYADNVVCNNDGDCWKTKGSRKYDSKLNLKVYPSNWKWAESDNHKHRWRDHGDGHGYWRQGVWIKIK